MDRKVRKHLARRGIYRTRLPEEDTFTRRAPDFMRWFHKEVMGFDSDEYRQEFWREANLHGRTIGDMPYGLREYMRRRTAGVYQTAMANALCYCLWLGGSFAIWLIRRQIDRHLGRLRRPAYYEAERRRRQALADERRRIRRRSTLNACPTADALREAFARRRDSAEAVLRLGSLLEDLECYVDNSAVVAGGRVVGRRGGVREWLHDNAQDLYVHYKRLMHFKALAKRFRQAVGIADPLPADTVLQPAGIVHSSADGPSGGTGAVRSKRRGADTPAAEETSREFTSDEVPGEADAGRERPREFNSDKNKGGKHGERRKDEGEGNGKGKGGENRNGGELLREFNSEWNPEAEGGYLVVAKRKAREVMLEAKAAGGTALALEAQLARMLTPEFAPLDENADRKAMYGRGIAV